MNTVPPPDQMSSPIEEMKEMDIFDNQNENKTTITDIAQDENPAIIEIVPRNANEDNQRPGKIITDFST